MLKLLAALDAYFVLFADGPHGVIGMMVVTPIIMLLLAMKVPALVMSIVKPQKIM